MIIGNDNDPCFEVDAPELWCGDFALNQAACGLAMYAGMLEAALSKRLPTCTFCGEPLVDGGVKDGDEHLCLKCGAAPAEKAESPKLLDHAFIAGDPAYGWERQCSVIVPVREAGEWVGAHCGYPPGAHRIDATFPPLDRCRPHDEKLPCPRCDVAAPAEKRIEWCGATSPDGDVCTKPGTHTDKHDWDAPAEKTEGGHE